MNGEEKPPSVLLPQNFNWVLTTPLIALVKSSALSLTRVVSPFFGISFYKLRSFIPNAPFSILMFSGGRERVHWEQMG